MAGIKYLTFDPVDEKCGLETLKMNEFIGVTPEK
jgi:hypothetical protein